MTIESMVPALTPLRVSAAAPVKRFVGIWHPHGAAPGYWSPLQEGKDFDFSFITKPLEAFRDRVVLITGLDMPEAMATDDEPGGDHARGAVLLSGARPRRNAVSPYLGATIDQTIAQKHGQDSILSSIQLGVEDTGNFGNCNWGYSCAYTNSISWSSSTQPLPTQVNPRVVFERLFGEGGNAAERRAALHDRASLLDSFSADIARLKRRVGAPDAVRVDQYLESVREIERQIQRAEAGAMDNELPDLDRPVGVPAAFEDHAKLMFDLQILAFQADITRVITFQMTRELSNRTYPEIGVADAHHPTSHHGNDPEKVEKISKINAFHVSLFAEFLEKMKATPDGDGSLLDHTLYLYGSGMGNPSLHDHENLPILVAGGAPTGLKGGQHIKYDKGTPLANLHLTLLDRVGVRLDSFADSDGKIADLFAPL